MEEKKTAKQVSINANAQPSQGEQKQATYEELNNYCIQLFNQNKQLLAQLQQREMGNMFKRLDYLFLVLENKDSFSPDFVGDCASEITNALYVSGEDNEEEEKGE